MEARMQAMDLDVIVREGDGKVEGGEAGWNLHGSENGRESRAPLLNGTFRFGEREIALTFGPAPLRQFAQFEFYPPGTDLRTAERIYVRVAYGQGLRHLAEGGSIRIPFGGDSTLNIRYYREPLSP